MKYLIFPMGYDPMVASGPPTVDILRMGISWTQEETQKAQELEALAVVADEPKLGQWHRKVKL